MKGMKLKNKLYILIRGFDVYQGRNPFKLFLRMIACKLWDYKGAREQDMIFMNKKFTPCRKCGFFKFFMLSFVYQLGKESDKENGIEITNGFLHFGVAVILAVLILTVVITLCGLGLGIFEMVKELVERS